MFVLRPEAHSNCPPPPPPSLFFRPEGMVWDIQVQSLDHKSILPVLLSKASPSVTVDNLKPGG